MCVYLYVQIPKPQKAREKRNLKNDGDNMWLATTILLIGNKTQKKNYSNMKVKYVYIIRHGKLVHFLLSTNQWIYYIINYNNK